MSRWSLPFYVIYRNPSDFPGKWVLRVQYAEDGGQIRVESKPAYVGDSLDEARDALPWGTCNIHRMPGDDPVIYEVWV